jgi:hypothetical protein
MNKNKKKKKEKKRKRKILINFMLQLSDDDELVVTLGYFNYIIWQRYTLYCGNEKIRYLMFFSI